MSSAISQSRRVLIVLHEPELGGASRAVLRVAPHLEELGWTLLFWSPLPGRAARELHEQGYVVGGAPRLLRYGWRPLSTPPGILPRLGSVPGYLRGFRRWLELNAVDVVHANTLITIPEAVVARTAGRPTLLHAHEILARDARSLVAAYLMRRLVDGVVAPSRAAAAALRRAGVEAKVVKYGVPLPPLSLRRQDDGRPLVVGTVGTVSRRKGSDSFVEAAEEVWRTLPDAEFRMIGVKAPSPESAWADALVARAEARGIRCGTRDDIFAELAEWDVFVLPSREDPFPLAVLEAMASGLPVIATRVGGIPEQISPETGILVDPDDPPGLAAAIVDLARDPARRAALGAAARRRVEETLTLEQQARQLHESYLRAIEATAGRRRRAGRSAL